MLQKYSDKELLDHTETLRKKEKKLTTLILEHLQEIEKRKLYTELGHRSIYGYCVDGLGYSSAEATLRVNATRLITRHIGVKEKIDNGVISLTNASAAQSLFKEQKTSPKEQAVILKEIEGKSTRAVQNLLNQKAQKPRSLKLTLNERLLKKLELVQKDFDHISELETLEALMDQYLEKKKSSKPHRQSNKVPTQQRYITRKVKEIAYARAGGQCEYISAKTKKRCLARTHLNYDHIRPVALGGSSDLDNIRVLCSACNQRARVKAGLSAFDPGPCAASLHFKEKEFLKLKGSGIY